MCFLSCSFKKLNCKLQDSLRKRRILKTLRPLAPRTVSDLPRTTPPAHLSAPYRKRLLQAQSGPTVFYIVSLYSTLYFISIHVFLDVPVFPLHVNFLSRGVSRAPRRRASQKHDQQRLRNSTVGFRTGLGNLKKPNCASRFLFS